jgi:hypothetical protein
MVNTLKLSKELVLAGITTHGNCDSNGIVWDDNNNDISKRPDVALIIANHDPTPDPLPPTPDERIAELEKQNAMLIKAVDTSKLTISEVAELTKAVAVEAKL